MTADATATDDPDPSDDGHRVPGRTVIAAGGIVLDEGATGPAVVVIHRPAYDDWSLPKGHVEPGEALEAAALREVAEETGVVGRIIGPAGTTAHHVVLRDGAALKQVHWFLMDRAGGSDPGARSPDDEVDRAEWWPVATAVERLTHRSERELLRGVLLTRPQRSDVR